MNERARKRYACFLCVTSMSGLSGFRDKETGNARANVQSPHLRLLISRNYWVSSHITNFSTVGQSDPEIRRLGPRAHVQTCPTPPMTCGKHLVHDPELAHQNWTQITPGPTKTRRMTYDVIQGHWPLSDDLDGPRESHNVNVNHGCHLPTPIHVHITSINAEVRKFQTLKRYGTQISLDMTLEIRSQVKGHSRYGLEIFREGVTFFKR